MKGETVTILYYAIPGRIGDAEEIEESFRVREHAGSTSAERAKCLSRLVLERYHPDQYRITYASIVAKKWRQKNQRRLAENDAQG